MKLFTLWECLLRDRCLKPLYNHANSLADGATPTLTHSRRQLILANAPSTPQISLPSRSGHTALRFCDFLAQKYCISDTDSPFALQRLPTVELCSPCGEVPWLIAVVNRRALDLLRVSVLSVCGFHMHAMRFMGFLNAHFARISISKPSALGLRCLRRSHPRFPVAPRKPRPLMSPRPGVRMLSSRLWRVSRQASPFLSLPRPSIFCRDRNSDGMDRLAVQQMDFFASRESSQCPLWFSLSFPTTLGIDAFAHPWPNISLYAFPPIKLILAVLLCIGLPESALLGRHRMVSAFMRGVRRLRPARPTAVPSWDLSVVLEGLVTAPFEPLESAPERILTLKVTLLLALTSLKRVGDLQALSVSEMCMDFAPGLVKVTLRSRPGYILKVLSTSFRSQVVTLHSFHPPPFASSEDEKLRMLCPVRALKLYVDRSKVWRKSSQLLVCFGAGRRGLATSKQRISHWVRDGISLAYEARDLPSPLSLRAHSTRGVASSQALFRGVPLEDICVAAGWSSPHTFVRFYNLDIDTVPGSQILSV